MSERAQLMSLVVTRSSSGRTPADASRSGTGESFAGCGGSSSCGGSGDSSARRTPRPVRTRSNTS